MSAPTTATLSEAELASATAALDRLLAALDTVLFGQRELTELTVIGVLARGHILLEGLPGLGKTELVKGLAKALGLDARRVQFTPDLLPGDITGNPMLQEVEGKRVFVFQRGPIFANILLADEINRASPKTQSALLEAMQERRVTAGGETHALPDPFFVLATQNPIDLEGTYPLPEAQLDRFLFKIDVRRNPPDVLERIVLHREIGVEPVVAAVVTRDELTRLLALARRVHLPAPVANYISRLVNASHPGESAASAGVRFGASPRAALALAAAAKARGLRSGRPHASFEDVQAVARPVLAHRILLEHTARLDGATSAGVVEKLLAEVPAQEKPLPHSLAAAKIS
jgi:MoxR-like ATPase